MKRAAIAVSACIGMAPLAAFAADWSLNTSQVETIEASDNLFMRTSPAAAIGSYSTLTANAEALMPTSKLNINVDGNYRKFWGPGVEGAPSESLSWGALGHYEHSEKGSSDREYLEANWRQSSTAFALLNEFGVITNTKGFLDRRTFTGGIDRSITNLDSLSLMATSTHTSYEPSGGGTPVTDTLARGSWRHRLSPLTALNASSEYELLNYENAQNSQIEIYRNQLGIDATLSPVLSFRGNIGPIYIVTSGGINPLSGIQGTLTNTSGTSSLLDWIGNAVLTYRAMKNTTLAIDIAQSVSSSVVGSLYKSDYVTAILTHSINSLSTLSFSASATRTTSTSSTDLASASVTYGYQLTKDLNAQLTYRYQHRFGTSGGSSIDPITGTPTLAGSGPASANSIVLVVSHHYTVLPHGN